MVANRMYSAGTGGAGHAKTARSGGVTFEGLVSQAASACNKRANGSYMGPSIQVAMDIGCGSHIDSQAESLCFSASGAGTEGPFLIELKNPMRPLC